LGGLAPGVRAASCAWRRHEPPRPVSLAVLSHGGLAIPAPNAGTPGRHRSISSAPGGSDGGGRPGQGGLNPGHVRWLRAAGHMRFPPKGSRPDWDAAQVPIGPGGSLVSRSVGSGK
jgi:hypothetical protein